LWGFGFLVLLGEFFKGVEFDRSMEIIIRVTSEIVHGPINFRNKKNG